MSGLQGQQVLLRRGAPGVAADPTGCRQHPVAGQHDAQRVATEHRPHDDLSLLDQAPAHLPPEVPDGDLWARVAALPQRQRDAVVLRFVGDLDHRAVAAALGTSPGMSRRLVSDAIATLRLDLRDQP